MQEKKHHIFMNLYGFSQNYNFKKKKKTAEVIF